jgi:hypothetical protein
MFRRVIGAVSGQNRPRPITARGRPDIRCLTQRPRPVASETMDRNRPRTATHNGSRSWMRVLCLSVLPSLVLTGCLRPYSKSVFDPPAATFPGITSQWHGKSDSDIRVLFVHGICTHYEAKWITNGWDQVFKGYFPSATKTVTTKPPVGQVLIIDHEYQIGQNKISGRYLIWSDLTAADKAKLNYDNLPTDTPKGVFTWKRAKINEELKASLLNDCLSDAVIYAGYRGADIQASMQNAICAALDGTPTNGACDFPATYRHGSRRIVIVTESLGSRMVFDAISALKIEAQRNGADALSAFDEAVSPITQIYMLANQLPILALAKPTLTQAASTTDPSASKTPAMATALSVLSDSRKRHEKKRESDPQLQATEPKLSLVAFTDPNDLLSYRLLTNDPTVVVTNTRVVNVITSNDTTYFGEVENPLTAHEGYDLNKDVLRLLFGGSARGKPQ